jgi:hypothetical protein
MTQPNLDNLTPVIVRPTPSEINNATEDISWNVDIGSDMCPITQEQFNSHDIVSRIHQCGHCFSQAGLRQWFTLSVYCPVCRYDIRDYTDNTDNTNEDNEDSNNGSLGRDIYENEHDNDEHNNDEHDNDEHNNDEHDNDEANTNNISNNTTDSDMFTSDLLRSVTTQLAQSLNENMSGSTNASDISNNTANNLGEITFEYIIQTPDNVYSTSSLSNDSLSNLFRNTFLGNNR